jgi:hypothetical protein
MRSMIESIDDGVYAAPARGRSSGGIGGHVRHCLDHVDALVAAARTGLCAYDRRTRGTAVEASRCAALQRIGVLQDALSEVDLDRLETPVAVESRIDTDGSTLVTRSTFGRELVYVMSHTIHHHAILAHLLHARGMSVGSRFGVAPATPSHEDQLACAQ